MKSYQEPINLNDLLKIVFSAEGVVSESSNREKTSSQEKKLKKK